MKGIVRIIRKPRSFRDIKGLIGISRDLQVYIDQKKIGAVKWNTSKDFEVNTGNRVIWVQMDWCRSRKTKIKVTENNPMILECRMARSPLNPESLLAFLSLSEEEFFVLRPPES